MPDSLKTNPRNRLEQREEDILNAATELFIEQGFHATSTRKIAAQAGIAEGTVFHYFRTKNELMTAILARFYQELTSSAREVVHEIMDTRERLNTLAENHVAKLLANNALMLRLIQVSLGASPEFHSHTKSTILYRFNYEFSKVFDSVIKEGIQRGDLRSDLNLPICRDVYFGSLEYGSRTISINPEQNNHEYTHGLVQPLWESIRNRDAESNQQPGQNQRLEDACQRIEQAARVIEKKL